MLKTFLSAVFAGLVSLLVFRQRVAWFGAFFDLARDEYATCLQRGLVAGLGGGALLGAGMALAGACPGMVLAQVRAINCGFLFLILLSLYLE